MSSRTSAPLCPFEDRIWCDKSGRPLAAGRRGSEPLFCAFRVVPPHGSHREERAADDAIEPTVEAPAAAAGCGESRLKKALNVRSWLFGHNKAPLTIDKGSFFERPDGSPITKAQWLSFMSKNGGNVTHVPVKRADAHRGDSAAAGTNRALAGVQSAQRQREREEGGTITYRSAQRHSGWEISTPARRPVATSRHAHGAVGYRASGRIENEYASLG